MREQFKTPTMTELFKDIPSEGSEVDLAKLFPDKVPAEEKKGEEEPETEPDQEGEEEAEPKEKLPDAKSGKGKVEKEEPAKKENHDERRWRTLMLRQKEKDRKIEELTQKLDSFSGKFEDLTKTQKETVAQNVPQEFVDLFGDNPKAWPLFQKLITAESEKLVSARDAARTEQEKQKAEAGTKANTYIEEEMERLSEETGMDLTNPKDATRNAILKIALDYAPVDEDGNISFEKCIQIYNLTKPKKAISEERKRAAKLSGEDSESTSSEEDAAPKVGQLRNKSWKSFLST